ncbi:hypothetical protein [Rhizobium azibense]|uniref:Uncharacterized protein n=1 Tax=Rhizobium azibense TaxID=1136135 RepID=A0A4R3RPS2_9HYPH|nr:hypothetical protein [Rhizobium azibense]TCU33546.1 hypothetical protein EV129_11551 [Rhizobium azibense]
MIQDFVSHLKALFESLFLRTSNATPRDKNTGEASRNDEREDRELREHELFHWSAAPGPWY